MNTENSSRYSRRSILGTGGLLTASAAFLAACGQSKSTGIARLGEAPEIEKLADEKVTDAVLLRTAQSLENMISTMLSDSAITAAVDAQSAPLLKKFADAHTANAKALAPLVSANGGEPYSGVNEKLMVAYGQTALDLVKESKDSTDAVTLAMALETLAAASYQYFVSLTASKPLRAEMMKIAATSSRRAAAAAQTLNGGTAGIAPSVNDAGEPNVATLPSAFGLLSSVQISLGPVNKESGVRASVLMDTPSLNSFIY